MDDAVRKGSCSDSHDGPSKMPTKLLWRVLGPVPGLALLTFAWGVVIHLIRQGSPRLGVEDTLLGAIVGILTYSLSQPFELVFEHWYGIPDPKDDKTAHEAKVVEPLERKITRGTRLGKSQGVLPSGIDLSEKREAAISVLFSSDHTWKYYRGYGLYERATAKLGKRDPRRLTNLMWLSHLNKFCRAMALSGLLAAIAALLVFQFPEAFVAIGLVPQAAALPSSLMVMSSSVGVIFFIGFFCFFIWCKCWHVIGVYRDAAQLALPARKRSARPSD